MGFEVADQAIFNLLQKQFKVSIFVVQIAQKECVLGNISYPRQVPYAPLYYSGSVYPLICQSCS